MKTDYREVSKSFRTTKRIIDQLKELKKDVAFKTYNESDMINLALETFINNFKLQHRILKKGRELEKNLKFKETGSELLIDANYLTEKPSRVVQVVDLAHEKNKAIRLLNPGQLHNAANFESMYLFLSYSVTKDVYTNFDGMKGLDDKLEK